MTAVAPTFGHSGGHCQNPGLVALYSVLECCPSVPEKYHVFNNEGGSITLYLPPVRCGAPFGGPSPSGIAPAALWGRRGLCKPCWEGEEKSGETHRLTQHSPGWPSSVMLERWSAVSPFHSAAQTGRHRTAFEAHPAHCAAAVQAV